MGLLHRSEERCFCAVLFIWLARIFGRIRTSNDSMVVFVLISLGKYQDGRLQIVDHNYILDKNKML